MNRTIKPKPIICPHCRGNRSLVKEARIAPSTFKDRRGWTGGFWRKRECLSCGHTFATEESVVIVPISSTSSNRTL